MTADPYAAGSIIFWPPRRPSRAAAHERDLRKSPNRIQLANGIDQNDARAIRHSLLQLAAPHKSLVLLGEQIGDGVEAILLPGHED